MPDFSKRDNSLEIVVELHQQLLFRNLENYCMYHDTGLNVFGF